MSFLEIQRARVTLKSVSFIILMTLMVSTQGWGEGVRDVFIGFPKNEEPVKAISDCIDPQEVFGQAITIYLGSATEPTIAVNPKHPDRIVAAWQQSRISDAGALEAGIAYSKDRGHTWTQTTVPFQACNGGIIQRVSDVWLSYARNGSRVYLLALAINATTDPRTQNQQGIVISISENNGETWSAPRFLASSISSLNEPTAQFPIDDKCAITADPNHSDRAYAVWDRFEQASSMHSTTQISLTKNGGLTWTPNQVLYDPFPDLTKHNQSNGIQNDALTINNVIVVLPKKKEGDWSDDHWGNFYNKQRRLSGTVLNFMVRQYAKPGATDAQYVNDIFPFQFTLFDIAMVRSENHGKTWEKSATVVAPLIDSPVFTGGYTYGVNNQITGGVGTLMRDGNEVPSYNVNPKNGFLYVVWQSGQFRADHLPQIALSTSRNGGKTWSQPVRVNRTPPNAPNPQAFTPFVAVTKNGQVGILYCDFRKDDKSDPNNTKTDVWLAIYQEVQLADGGNTGIGLEFVREIRLSKESYIAQNGPTTTLGVMTNGDYQFLATRGNDFYAVYTKSLPGPFAAPTVFLNDPVNSAVILLDSNYRQAPFVSVIESEK